MTHTRGFPAIIATLVLALAFAACGSDDNSSSSNASSGGSTSSGAAAGIATAQERLKPYQAAPTEITIKEPLKGAPPAGKTLVMLGTNDPNNQKLQKSLKDLAGHGEVELRGRQLRPRQPGDVQRRDRHGDHEEGQLHRRGRHPAHARHDQEGPGRRREVGADVRAPGRGQGPDHRQRERVRQRRADGQGPRRLLRRRTPRARATSSSSTSRRIRSSRASPTASRPRSRSSARIAR